MKGVLKNCVKLTGIHLCQGLFLKKACNFVEKEILAHVFCCEFRETSKNTFSTEHLLMTLDLLEMFGRFLNTPLNSVSVSWAFFFQIMKW